MLQLHTFQSYHFTGWVHDGRVCRDLPADGITWVVHVYDNYLSSLSNLLTHTDEFIRLHGKSAEPNVGRIDPNALELKTEISANSHGNIPLLSCVIKMRYSYEQNNQTGKKKCVFLNTEFFSF